MIQDFINNTWQTFYLFPIGIFVGIISALLGIGGGLLYVPALALIKASPIQSVATSLVAITLGATSGTLQNWRMKSLKIETVSLLTFPAMLATEIGVHIASNIPSKFLLLSFAAFQIIAIWLINLKNQLHKKQKNNTELSEKANSTYNILQFQAIGLVAGILSGLFGVGGGIVMVPLQVLLLNVSIKDAVQTSYGAIVLVSLWAVSRYAIADSTNVLILPGLILGCGSLIGSNLGARLLPKLSDHLVKFLFTILLVILAIYMSSKALLA